MRSRVVFVLLVVALANTPLPSRASNRAQDYLRKYQNQQRLRAEQAANDRQARHELHQRSRPTRDKNKKPPPQLIRRQIAEYTNPDNTVIVNHLAREGYSGWKIIWANNQWHCVSTATPGFTPTESVHVNTYTGELKSTRTGKVLYSPQGLPSSRDNMDQGVLDPLIQLSRNNCIKYSRSYLDTKYSSQGKSVEDGFSALGLIDNIYTRLGYPPKVETIEDLREKFGTKISCSLDEVAPGDLLFFKLYSKKKKKSTLMVAICVDKKEMVYSSFTRNKVIARTHDLSFWRKTFIGANRVFIK